MKKLVKIVIGLFVVGLVVIASVFTYYKINIGKVSDDSTLREVTINEKQRIKRRLQNALRMS